MFGSKKRRASEDKLRRKLDSDPRWSWRFEPVEEGAIGGNEAVILTDCEDEMTIFWAENRPYLVVKKEVGS